MTKLASMVKLKAGRVSREVADTCLQFWGGMGYSKETHVNRAFRDLRLLSIGIFPQIVAWSQIVARFKRFSAFSRQ